MRKNSTRLWWDAELGWVVDVPVALTAEQLHRIAAWALPHQKDRFHTIPLGDRKDECARSIRELEAGRLQQRIVDDDGDGLVFASTEKTRPDRLIFT